MCHSCSSFSQIVRFLLARLYIDSLLGYTAKKKVLAKLETLKGGSEALDQAYAEALERIDRQVEGHRDLARQALSWITYAKRPLTAAELCDALAIEADTSALDPDNVSDIEEVVSACAGLVILDEDSSTVQLVHYTTQEYLERKRTTWLPGAQQEIAEACLTYLSFSVFRDAAVNLDILRGHFAVDNPFFDYSARYWGDHVRPVERATSSLVLTFLSDDLLVNALVRWGSTAGRFHSENGSNLNNYWWFQRSSSRLSRLDITALYGLPYLTEELLACQDLDDSISIRKSLLYAAEGGYEPVVRLLLARDDIDVNIEGCMGLTPLIIAVAHEPIVRLLLSRDDMDINTKSWYGVTPLRAAIELQEERVTRLLISRNDLDVNVRDRDLRSPLYRAVEIGGPDIVRSLISRNDADVNLPDRFGLSPLFHAVLGKNEGVVRILISRDDIEVNLRDPNGQSPLFYAVDVGHEGIVEALVSRTDTEVNLTDKHGRLPLFYAVRKKHKGIIEALLSRDDIEKTILASP